MGDRAQPARPGSAPSPGEGAVVVRRMRRTDSGSPRSAQDLVKPQASAGALCLDFLTTIESSDEREVDLLPRPEHLGKWLGFYGLPVPAGGLTDEDLDAARALRAAVDRIARALVDDAEVAPHDVRLVNTFAQRHTPVFLLRPGGRQRTVVEEIDVSGSMSVIARDAIHLFADSDLARLRECARAGCSTLFYDRSPSGARRWCAMKGCGEIVSSATYRQRRAAKGSP